jgi:hypothetical protein
MRFDDKRAAIIAVIISAITTGFIWLVIAVIEKSAK